MTHPHSRIRDFNPSVTRPTVYPQDIKDAANLLASDLVIAYALLPHHNSYVIDNLYRFMGPTGSGKSNVRDLSLKQLLP